MILVNKIIVFIIEFLAMCIFVRIPVSIYINSLLHLAISGTRVKLIVIEQRILYCSLSLKIVGTVIVVGHLRKGTPMGSSWFFKNPLSFDT